MTTRPSRSVDLAGEQIPVEPEPELRRHRRFNRPTSPELEALYFQVAIHLTKRETAIFMHCLGRTTDGGKALAEMFLNPQPNAE
jgi:hypothetical protein